MEFDDEAELPLALAANFLRVLDDNEWVPLAEIPLRAGVANRAVDRLLGHLVRGGYAVVAVENRRKHARLTPDGVEAKRATRELVGVIERRWRRRHGASLITSLRSALEKLQPRLGEGLMPEPEGWRVERPWVAQTKAMIEDGALPHYPMLSSQGDWPDGA